MTEVIDFILFDGIGGAGEKGQMLDGIVDETRRVDRDFLFDVEINVIYAKWLASIGPANPSSSAGRFSWGPWLEESIQHGLTVLDAHFDLHPDRKVVLFGYSGGAAVVTRWLVRAQAARTEAERNRIVGAVTMANPYCCADPDDPDFFGIAGQHVHYWGIPHLEMTNPPDAIPRCHRRSPLRTLTDVGMDPSVEGLVRRCVEAEWQVVIPPLPEVPSRWSDWRFWLQPGLYDRVRAEAEEARRIAEAARAEAIEARAAWREAGDQIKAYLGGKAHGSDYVAMFPAAGRWVADRIEEALT